MIFKTQNINVKTQTMIFKAQNINVKTQTINVTYPTDFIIASTDTNNPRARSLAA